MTTNDIPDLVPVLSVLVYDSEIMPGAFTYDIRTTLDPGDPRLPIMLGSLVKDGILGEALDPAEKLITRAEEPVDATKETKTPETAADPDLDSGAE